MELRLASNIDKNLILQFYKDGSEKLKSEGVDQWQGPKIPNLNNFPELINNHQLYVLEDDANVVGTIIIKNFDYDYENNMQGQWLQNISYIALHRVATGKEFQKKGYGKKIIELAEEYATENSIHSIRIDTHKDNKSMQGLIKKLGYTYCGIVYINGTDKRLAYEKIIKK